ncbi:MAG: hypothetical protein NTX35_22970 [Verrucomicrobia bacterium]|nr:hypothetical protein [Verrucomicrobiota bacterium]
MSRETSVHALLFAVDQVPMEAVIGSNGSTRRISIPGKKAMVNKLTGLVPGVVSRDYRVVTNQEAVNLARDVCEKAFPGLSSVEWEAKRAAAKALTPSRITLVSPSGQRTQSVSVPADPPRLNTRADIAANSTQRTKLSAYHDINQRMLQWQQEHDPT